MNLRQLEFALALAEEGNFTRAAARCHVVQSALSHQIAKLEEEFGTLFFVRNSRHVALTTAGKVFLAQAEQVRESLQRLHDEMAATTGEIRGMLRIGSIATLNGIDLAACLGHYHRRHPQVDVRLAIGASEQLLADLGAQKSDIAFLGLWVGDEIADDTISAQMRRIDLLCEEPLQLILPHQHRLAKRKLLELAELANENMVDYPRASKARQQTDRAFADAGLTRRVGFEVMHIDWQVKLVKEGVAVAFVPQSSTPTLHDVAIISVNKAPRRRVYMAYHAHPSPASAAFIACIKEWRTEVAARKSL